MRSSSVRPTRGDFSAVASVRSSSGSSAARPAATRSITAICSPILSRSAPATGTPASLSARITASKAAPRLRTSTSTSPAFQTRPVSSPLVVQRFTACGDAAARRRPAARAARARRPAAPRRRAPPPPAGVSIGPELHEARRVRTRALVHGADGLVLERQALEMRARPRRWRRPPRAPPCAERNDRVRRHVLEAQAPPRATLLLPVRRLVLEFAAAPRPGSRRSTAWDRRPRRACARARRCAPKPAVKSSVIRRRISHCSGFVSCASSISTWSMPRSSL